MPRVIGVKQLHKDLKKITQQVQKGERFIVMKHAKPLFWLVPYKEEKEFPYVLKDLEQLQFVGKVGSKPWDIDQIVYGK